MTLVHCFIDQMVNITVIKRRKRIREKIQVVYRETYSPYRTLLAPSLPNANDQRLEEGSSPVVDTVLSTFRKERMQAPSTRKAPPPLSTLWSDINFDTL